MQTFSFNPPINLVVEGKWLLAVSSLECTNSVFIITNEKTIPSQSLYQVITKPNLLKKFLMI